MQLAHPYSTLQISKPLYAWMKADPAWRTFPLSRRLRAGFDARLFSFNWSVAQSLIPPLPSSRPISPILIAGLWRSGTTALHEMMASALGLATPLTYQCMAPSQIHLGASTRSSARTTRPMDGQSVSTLSPQEDEFALLSLGEPSLYRFFLMPHRLKDLSGMLQEQYWIDRASWLTAWHRFLGMVSHQSGQSTVLVKSPNHTFRLASILGAHPQAKIIWMTREPEALFRSNMGMWRAMSRMYGWSTCDEEALSEFLIQAICTGTSLLERYTTQLPREQLLVVSQSELQHSPVDTIGKIAKWLDPNKPVSMEQIARATSQSASPSLNQGGGSAGLPKEIARHVHHVNEVASRLRGGEDA